MKPPPDGGDQAGRSDHHGLKNLAQADEENDPERQVVGDGHRDEDGENEHLVAEGIQPDPDGFTGAAGCSILSWCWPWSMTGSRSRSPT